MPTPQEEGKSDLFQYSGLQPREGKRYRFVCVGAAKMAAPTQTKVYHHRMQSAITRHS